MHSIYSMVYSISLTFVRAQHVAVQAAMQPAVLIMFENIMIIHKVQQLECSIIYILGVINNMAERILLFWAYFGGLKFSRNSTNDEKIMKNV